MTGPKRLAGIDGCSTGWVSVIAEAGNFSSARLAHSESLTDLLSREVIDFAIVDMPIGLVDGPASRDVELAMRKYLPGKASSVFPTPARLAIAEWVYFDASFVNQQILGKGLPKQTFALFPKLREVDKAARDFGQSRLREGHPEVSFAALKGMPVLSKKRELEGRSERIALLQSQGIPAMELLQARIRGAMADDDILDASVLLWSASRFNSSQHITLPPVPQSDSAGLEMSVIA